MPKWKLTAIGLLLAGGLLVFPLVMPITLHDLSGYRKHEMILYGISTLKWCLGITGACFYLAESYFCALFISYIRAFVAKSSIN